MSNEILNRHKPFRALVSFVTVTAFIFSFIFTDALAAAVQPGVAAGSDAVADIADPGINIPSYLGMVKETYNGVSDRVVIHIQDAHCNYRAQHKIAELLEYLRKNYGISTVNLEGGKGNYDLSVFTDIRERGMREKVADDFVLEGLLNGAEYFAINDPGKVTLWGIEDPALYFENLGIYRRSLEYRDRVERQIESLASILEKLKQAIYSDELLELDRKYAENREELIDFREYLLYLMDNAESNGIDADSFANISLLRESLGMEDGINFKKANEERDQMIDTLHKILSQREREELVSSTVRFSQKRITQKEFYGYLARKASGVRIGRERFPDLFGYIDYISLYDSADRSSIMKEMENIRKALREKLYENDDQARLDGLWENLQVIRKLFAVSLKMEDYRYYRESEDSFKIEDYISFIREKTADNDIDASLNGDIYEIDLYRKAMIKFYECSFKRDEAFLRNMRFGAPGPGEGNIRHAVLITGGFHAENLTGLLRKRGISYLTIIPEFRSQDPCECPYFRLLSGGRSSIESMLETGVSDIAIMSMLSEMNMPGSGRELFSRAVHVREALLKGANITVRMEKGAVIVSNERINDGSQEKTLPDGTKVHVTPADTGPDPAPRGSKKQKWWTGWIKHSERGSVLNLYVRWLLPVLAVLIIASIIFGGRGWRGMKYDFRMNAHQKEVQKKGPDHYLMIQNKAEAVDYALKVLQVTRWREKKDENVADQIAALLDDINTMGEPAVPHLIKALENDEYSRVAKDIITVLGEIAGRASYSTRAAITGALRKVSHSLTAKRDVRDKADAVLMEIIFDMGHRGEEGGKTDEVVPVSISNFMGKFEEIEPVEVVEETGKLRGLIKNMDTEEVVDLSTIKQEEITKKHVERHIKSVEELMESVRISSDEKEILVDIIKTFRSGLPARLIATGGGVKGFFGIGEKKVLAVDKNLLNGNPLSFLHEIVEYLKHADPGMIERMERILREARPDEDKYAGMTWFKRHEDKYRAMGKGDYFETRRKHYVIRAFTRQVFKDKDEELTQMIKGSGVYEAAKDLIPGIMYETRKAPTYAIEPAASIDSVSPVIQYLRRTERSLGGEGHNIITRSYLADSVWADNVKETVKKVLPDFYNDATNFEGKDYSQNKTRMVIRLISRDGKSLEREKGEITEFIREGLMGQIMSDKKDMADEDRKKMADFMIKSKIRFVEAYVGDLQHLNTVIDLFTDITMMECDRYGKPDGYADEQVPEWMKERFLRLLGSSITNYDELVREASRTAGEGSLAAILAAIFAGYMLRIKPVDWKSIRRWKDAQDAVLSAL